jgi:flagellar hook assembly protein FlgD
VKLGQENIRPGINYIIWDGENDLGIKAANGVYLLRITTQEKTIVKKIAIAR